MAKIVIMFMVLGWHLLGIHLLALPSELTLSHGGGLLTQPDSLLSLQSSCGDSVPMFYYFAHSLCHMQACVYIYDGGKHLESSSIFSALFIET